MNKLNTQVVDTHTHFWDPQNIEYDWLADAPDLNRHFGVEEYNRATEGMGIEKIVFVECNCLPHLNHREVDWVSRLASKDQRIKAIVAHADLLDVGEIDQNLEQLQSQSLIRGIRHNIQFNEKGFALQPNFVKGIRNVFEHKLHFELCITHDQMQECVELVGQLPDNPIILDHSGKPGIKDGEIDQWKRDISELSNHENVMCKISGLITEADHLNWTHADLVPYVDHVVKCFGMDRIVYGGDWPVSVLAGGYRRWFDFVEEWLADWSAHDRGRFLNENASRFYRI